MLQRCSNTLLILIYDVLSYGGELCYRVVFYLRTLEGGWSHLFHSTISPLWYCPLYSSSPVFILGKNGIWYRIRGGIQGRETHTHTHTYLPIGVKFIRASFVRPHPHTHPYIFFRIPRTLYNLTRICWRIRPICLFGNNCQSDESNKVINSTIRERSEVIERRMLATKLRV